MYSIDQVELKIDRLPPLPKEHSYKCIYDKKDQTTATNLSFGLSCPLLKVIHRPKIQSGKGKVYFLTNIHWLKNSFNSNEERNLISFWRSLQKISLSMNSLIFK